ncbi:MAG TPA: dihydrolipoamide acetyltransferase family protein [Paenibacillaceae bacterium]
MAKQLTEIRMPQLAESLVSATVERWLKEPGHRVEMYEPICEIITDKVNAEIPSTVAGVMAKILVGPGETVEVGTPICLIETEGEGTGVESPVPAGQASGEAVAAGIAGGAGAAASPAFDPAAPMRHRYSPAVRKLAEEYGVDLTAVTGTGLGGRITRKDVLNHIARGGAAGRTAAAPKPAAFAPAGAAPAAALAAPVSGPAVLTRASAPAGAAPAAPSGVPTIEVEEPRAPGREYYIDVTPIRKAIARNMRQSVSEIPHAWTSIEVDVTNLVALRNRWKDEFRKQEGVNLTYLPFLIKAVVSAIRDYPIMNSVWADDKIIVKRDINISLAVGTEDSVLTPVIRNADQKTIVGLAHEIHELARKTREGKLTLEDMQGGTFTVNNTGTFGSILSVPIINYPQAAILTMEAIVKRPVVIGDMIAIRSMVNLCLSFDHRILDGVICGRFHQRVKENLESYTIDTKLY